MDPFVVTSLGKKTYRTRVVRHNLNPVFEEKLVFQVLRHEVNYSLNFSVVDRDKLSGNDYVGSSNFPVETAKALAPEADPATGLYRLPEPPDESAMPAPGSSSKKSRFRLPLSRSSSSSSLNRMTRPSLKKENSQSSQSSVLGDLQQDLPLPPTSAPQGQSSN
ncbi:phosphatidylserine decarboxylase, partial [Cryomyces antarcticus]